MNTETFFARLFEDREFNPGHFPDYMWSSDDFRGGVDTPWLERLDRYIGIWDVDLVMELPHRSHQWPTIEALRAAGFVVNLRAFSGGYWSAYGSRSDPESGPYWHASIKEERRVRAAPYYSADVGLGLAGPANHRVEWGAVGETPDEALAKALTRAREGVGVLLALGAP